MTYTSTVNPADRLSARLPQALKPLADIAYNYWWCWTPDMISLFQSINPDEWERCRHNPIALLETISYDRLTQLASEPNYMQRLRTLSEQFTQYVKSTDT